MREPLPTEARPRPSSRPATHPEPASPAVRRTLPAALPLMLVVLAGCIPFGRPGGAPAEEAERPKHVTIQVENLNWSAIHVYVQGEGASRQSLGVVTSQNEAGYEVRVAHLGPRKELRLIAEPVGERGAFVSDPILFEPGDTITWTIQQPIIHSRVMVQ